MNINFKYFCNVGIFICGERNKRSEFLIISRLVVSKVQSYFSYILSPPKYLILLNQYRETSELSVLKVLKISWGVQKSHTNLGTVSFICTWLPLILFWKDKRLVFEHDFIIVAGQDYELLYEIFISCGFLAVRISWIVSYLSHMEVDAQDCQNPGPMAVLQILYRPS